MRSSNPARMVRVACVIPWKEARLVLLFLEL